MNLWDEEALCRNLGFSRSKAQKMRVRGDGPPYVKVGHLVRYRPEDVSAWLSDKLTHSTSKAA